MSVISDQRDELRDRAGTLRAFAESIGNEVARNTMVIAATEMLEAAGTICELRCKMEDMVDQRDEIERIRVENAKLREICKSMRCALADYNDRVYLAALDETLIGARFDLQELGLEASDA